MSAASQNPLARGNDAIDARAAEWLARREAEGLMADEQQELDAWLEESLAHRVAYLRLEAAWGHTERLSVLRNSGNQTSIRRKTWPLQAAAACLVIGAGIAFGVLRQPQDRIYSTPVGGHEAVSFADGTKIELNTNTVIRARMTANQRTVWLDKGEAYFHVKYNAAHPFVVMIGDRRVTDLGTEFVIHRTAAQTEVAVVEGRVRFDAPDVQAPAKTTMLMQGDVATTTPDSLSVTKRTSQELATELAWRHGLLIFKYTSLADAAAEFNRYNRQKIVIADPNAARLTIIGTFPTHEVGAFIEVAQSVFGLRSENRGDEIVLMR